MMALKPRVGFDTKNICIILSIKHLTQIVTKYTTNMFAEHHLHFQVNKQIQVLCKNLEPGIFPTQDLQP